MNTVELRYDKNIIKRFNNNYSFLNKSLDALVAFNRAVIQNVEVSNLDKTPRAIINAIIDGEIKIFTVTSSGITVK